MRKAVILESFSNVTRVLAVLDADDAQYNPTNSNVKIIDDFTEPPEIDNYMSVNYPMYNNVEEKFFWVQIQYQNAATEEIFAIENLKVENNVLQQNLSTANENIDMLTEAMADMI